MAGENVACDKCGCGDRQPDTADMELARALARYCAEKGINANAFRKALLASLERPHGTETR